MPSSEPEVEHVPSSANEEVVDIDADCQGRKTFVRMSKHRKNSRKLEENGKRVSSTLQDQSIPTRKRSPSQHQNPIPNDDTESQYLVPGVKRPKVIEVHHLESPQPLRSSKPIPVPHSQRASSLPTCTNDVVLVTDDLQKPPHSSNLPSSQHRATRATTRRQKRADRAPSKSTHAAQRDDEHPRKGKAAVSSENHTTNRRTIGTRSTRTIVQKEAINLDVEVDCDAESSSSPPEEAAKHPKASPPPPATTKKRSTHVVVVDKELQEEVKALSAVDAPYDGPTELIFQYPPGERGKIAVTAEERERLLQRKYLNDSFIDFYMKYTERRLQSWHSAHTFNAKFFGSFFFRRLRSHSPIDYEGVKGWTKSEDIFKMKYIFVPICDSYHWSLIIVANIDNFDPDKESGSSVQDSSCPKIIYLDSLDPKRGTIFADAIRVYLQEEWFHRRQSRPIPEQNKKRIRKRFKDIQLLKPNVPIQTNEYDCGLYLICSLNLFLSNEGGARQQLLSGGREVHKLYNHCEVKTLRAEIVHLIKGLEADWALKHPAQETVASNVANDASENSSVVREEANPCDESESPTPEALGSKGESSNIDKGRVSPKLPVTTTESNNDDIGHFSTRPMEVESSEHAHLGGGDTCDLTAEDCSMIDRKRDDERKSSVEVEISGMNDRSVESYQVNDVDMGSGMQCEELSADGERIRSPCQDKWSEISPNKASVFKIEHEQRDCEVTQYTCERSGMDDVKEIYERTGANEHDGGKISVIERHVESDLPRDARKRPGHRPTKFMGMGGEVTDVDNATWANQDGEQAVATLEDVNMEAGDAQDMEDDMTAGSGKGEETGGDVLTMMYYSEG